MTKNKKVVVLGEMGLDFLETILPGKTRSELFALSLILQKA